MEPKELKKLAAACRAAGIKHYKDAAIEFTLSDETPPSTNRRKAHGEAISAPIGDVIDSSYSSDDLTEEQLLMWSSGEDMETM